MAPDPIGDAKKDIGLFVRIAGLAAKIGKIKIDMGKLRRSKDGHYHSIGVALHELYHASEKTLDSTQMMGRVSEYLNELKHIEKELKRSEEEITRIRAEFRQQSGGKDVPEPEEFEDDEEEEDEPPPPPKKKKKKPQ